MKNDLANYIERRKRRDERFAKDFEKGYARFKWKLAGRQIKCRKCATPG